MMKRFLLTASLAAIATSAAAQERESSDSGLQDIIVTASRVESAAQKTPISLTAYTAENLASSGVSSVSALQTIDPSVNFATKGDQAYVAIRGIASTDITETGDPSVPIARDGFFVNRPYAINTSFYDLERVEVLKGPQGTLFGRNSTGGLINIITRKPGKEPGANASVEIGNYDTVKAEAGIDVPVSDKMQIRASGIAHYHKGYRRLDVIGGRGDDDDTQSGRLQMALQPVEGLDINISYQHDNVDNTGGVNMKSPLGVLPTNFNEKRFPNYEKGGNRLKGDRLRWELSYELPASLTLYYAGGFDEQRFSHVLDATLPPGFPTTAFTQRENPRTWNHEVRLATPQDGRFTAQVGYFHFEEKNKINSGVRWGSTPFPAFNNQYYITFDYRTKTRSDAVFGQFGFRPIETVRLTAGARYTWDKKERTGQSLFDLTTVSFGFATPPGVVVLIPTPANGKVSDSKPTWHAGVDWTPTDRNMVYLKYDTGYKSGGFNSNGTAPSVPYGPENVKAWEIGSKNRFFDNHLQLNIAAFHQRYGGYQAFQLTSVLGGANAAQGVFNVGSATIKGVEAQAIASLDGFQMDANAAYLDAKFKRNVALASDGSGTARAIGGNSLPNAPRWSITAGVQYDINAGDLVITPRIDGKYSSKYYFTVFNDADIRQGSYTTGNLSLTVAPKDGPWRVQGFVRNFTDKVVFSNAARDFNIPPGVNTYEFMPPRTYGVRLSYDW